MQRIFQIIIKHVYNQIKCIRNKYQEKILIITNYLLYQDLFD